MNTGCVTIRDGGVDSNRLRLQCALQVVNDGAGYAYILRAKPMQTPVLSPLPASVFISGICCPHAYVIKNVIMSYRLVSAGFAPIRITFCRYSLSSLTRAPVKVWQNSVHRRLW